MNSWLELYSNRIHTAETEVCGIVAPGRNCYCQRTMLDEATLAQMNGAYSLPADAGPAWRAACAAGVDMSLIEDALRMTPLERLRDHQRALNLVLTLEESRLANDPGR